MMMKMVYSTVVLWCVLSSAQAQFLNTWFRQKNEQRKQLGLQIAALKVYKGYLKTGYNIVQGGLSLVGVFKEGEFSLHKDYFSAMDGPGPAAEGSSRLERARRLLKFIPAGCDTVIRRARSGLKDAPGFRDDFIRMASGLRARCEAGRSTLETAMQQGASRMSEEERMRRIDAVCQELEKLSRVLVTVYRDLRHLEVHRKRLATDL